VTGGRATKPANETGAEREVRRLPEPEPSQPLRRPGREARPRTHHGLRAPGCHLHRRLRPGDPAALPLSA